MISNISPKCFHLTLTTLILLLGNAETQGDFNYNHNATPTANMENKDTNYRNKNNNNNHITPVSESESSSSAAAVFAAAMSALSTTAATSMIANSNNDRSLVHCGNTQKMVDNCFRDLPPHLMEFLQSPKIVIDEKEIKNKCNVFHHGMRCFDDYMVRCIPKHNVRILNNNVEGARKFFTKFCDDPVFQKSEYFRIYLLI
ncbi:uncharacterized protein LOC101892398 [Musca domestica]|uniref:Uncharacterized protein LOC101892398 n=1 Tax=Musca domestica TaxID=7370 RepID=A0A1I8NAE6_MUSDO|nr:uncharacterized protein LOC101892398 [Musca domestica]